MSYFLVYRHLQHIPGERNTNIFLQDLKNQKYELMGFILNSVFFALLMNSDILIVKNIFDAKIAGRYAALSVIAKFLLFLLLAVETVYYSQVAEYEKSQVPLHLLRNPLLLIV